MILAPCQFGIFSIYPWLGSGSLHPSAGQGTIRTGSPVNLPMIPAAASSSVRMLLDRFVVLYWRSVFRAIASRWKNGFLSGECGVPVIGAASNRIEFR